MNCEKSKLSGSEGSALLTWQERTIIDDDGYVALCFGVSATMYFTNGHTYNKRLGALACFEEFEALAGKELKWHCVGVDSNVMNPVAALKNRDMSPYLLSEKWESDEARDHGWSFYWHGGVRDYDASPLRIHAYGSPRAYSELDGSLSFLTVSFPLDWLQGRWNSFLDIILRWSNRLSPLHGYAGITLILSPDRAIAQAVSPQVPGIAFRHPGIEIDRPMSHKMVTRSVIKGGNWLTLLSTGFADALGGEREVRDSLSAQFSVHDFDTGLAILAGVAPEAGDINRHRLLPVYRELSELLKPIRVTNHPAIYPLGGFADADRFQAWIDRFDT